MVASPCWWFSFYILQTEINEFTLAYFAMKIITGMHRSGTSFVTSIIAHLQPNKFGSRALVPTDKWNRAGYYEDLEIVILNDKLILGDWFGIEKFRKTPSGERPLWAVVSMAIMKFRYLFLRSIKSICSRQSLYEKAMREISQGSSDLFFKDPRFSLTLGVWLNVVPIESVLYSFRHPLEVAQSLKKRENLPLWLGLKIWAFHVETFLAQAENFKVTYVHFNNFFDPELAQEEVKRCFAFAKKKYDPQEGEKILEKILKKDLKRNTVINSDISREYFNLYEKLILLHAKSKGRMLLSC